MSTDIIVATRQVHQQIDARQDEFRCALPPHIQVSKFRRTLLTAISKNSDLLRADRVSLFQSAMDCAQDGLLPDGREAALVTFGGKVQYLPMVRGILKRMRNSGMVTAPTAQLVYRNDKFRYWVDDDGQHLQHEFDVFSERGEVVGVYARAKTTDGEVHLEVMSRAEVDYIRYNFSRQPDGQMWKKSWGEAARKTVLRRLAKVLPCSTDLELTFERGDGELPEVDAAPVPPRPALSDFQTAAAIDDADEIDANESEGELYQVLDAYGCIEYEGPDCGLAISALIGMLEKAKDDGERESLREANPDIIGFCEIAGNGEDGAANRTTSSPAAPAASAIPLADQQPAGTFQEPGARSQAPGSKQEVPTPLWDAAPQRKKPGMIFGLGCVSSPRHTRYFPTVAAWCAALCELADALSDEDALALWETNLTVHTQLARDFKTDVEQQHLKAAADHFTAINKAMQGISP